MILLYKSCIWIMIAGVESADGDRTSLTVGPSWCGRHNDHTLCSIPCDWWTQKAHTLQDKNEKGFESLEESIIFKK